MSVEPGRQVLDSITDGQNGSKVTTYLYNLCTCKYLPELVTTLTGRLLTVSLELSGTSTSPSMVSRGTIVDVVAKVVVEIRLVVIPNISSISSASA